MGKSATDLPLPPIAHRADGHPRRIGVEIELSGLSLEQAAEIVRGSLDGRLRQAGRHELEIDGDPAGRWRIELDFELLKELGRRERGEDLGDVVHELAEDALRSLAERVVPVEVISPPLPMSRLSGVNDLIRHLREAGARGTRDDPLYAFGLQLNPEMPDTDADTIRHYLQAYLCVEDWLRVRAKVDLTRRLTFFADPFPKAYARLAVSPQYTPDRDRLIDDYLDANPTRNRGLDLLPLLTELDPHRVRRAVQDTRVAARPTLHYRLPNSEIDDPDWDLSVPWADWLVVERLAADPRLLAALCACYSKLLEHPLEQLTADWAARTGAWLNEHGLR